jgi:thiol:disulfide interchange protein DsbD
MLMSGVHCASAAEEPLPPDQAFRFNASLKGSDTVVAEIISAKKHYLYKNKVRFALKNASGVLIKEVKLPSGEMKNDPYFGLIEVYKSPVVAEIMLERAPRPKRSPFMRLIKGAMRNSASVIRPSRKLLI